MPLIAAAAAFATHLGLADVPSSAVTVIQKDIAFHPGRVEIKAGGSVTFINEDPFGHNVYSDSPGGEFDIGRQQVGQKNVITFKTPGTFVAECRIHPKMHLEIVVTP
jgi:plastocyanin